MSTRREFLGGVAAAGLAAGFGSSLFAAEPKRKTIVLHSAWDTINIGDIGHTPGTLRIIEEHLPGVHVILWASKLDERVTTLLMRRFPKLEIVQGSLRGKGERDKALRETISRADLFMRNSGMGQDTSWMTYCKEVGTPYGIYGQSYFRTMVEGKGADERIDLLNHAAFLYTRETKTLDILREAKIKTPVLEFGPDGCFGIDVRDDERALAFMKKHGLEERKFITIELRTNTPKYPGVDDTRPEKLNPLHPTPQQVADDERRAAVFRDVIAQWVRQTGHKVLLAPETIKELGHNKRLVHDPLPPELRKQVVNLDEFWNADEAASLFARAHTVICHEPHSPIIALANGTPIMHTFSEFHGPKCWMFKDIGLGEWLLEFDATPADTMADVLLKIDADYPAAQAKVNKAMTFVRNRQAESMNVVGRVLG